MRRLLVAGSLAVGLLSGCASIVSGTNQVLSVQARKGNDAVTGAACTLTNNKGTWFITTPGTVTIHRAYNDLNITCKKEGIDPGVAAIKSTTKGMAFGNLLFGGLIGVAVDTGSGAAYDYPSLITINMGIATTLSPPTTATQSTSDTPARTETVATTAAQSTTETSSTPDTPSPISAQAQPHGRRQLPK
jgi:hypothetical protein